MSAQREFTVDFIGVGAPKTGTTWLAECLKQHPEICFSKKKEINFFNEEYQFYHKNMPWNFTKGLGWYSRFFDHCTTDKKIRGEFSVNYFYDPETPRLIKETFPNVKILLVLRNPVDQLYSNFNHIRSQYKLASLEEMIEKQNGFVPYGYFSRYIKRYQEYFDQQHMRVFLYEDLKQDPQAFIKSVYDFLGVSTEFVPPSIKKIVNATAPKTAKEVRIFFSCRNYLIHKSKIFLLRHRTLLRIATQIDAFVRKHIISRLSGRKKVYTKLNPLIRKRLYDVYAQDIREVEKLCGISLQRWQ